MAEEGDPPFLQNLMDQSVEHNTYFLIGDPAQGPVERIGCVHTMLMAHSLVLRRVLGTQESSIAERWDIPITNVTPKTFKNLLRYTYGYHNMTNHSLNDTLDLLVVGEQLAMGSMLEVVCKQLVALLDHNTVCVMLRIPTVLIMPDLEQQILTQIKRFPEKVFNSHHLHEICPRNMRFLLNIKLVKMSEAEFWRVVVKWAQQKVLQQQPPVDSMRLDSYFQTCLVPPPLLHLRRCALNIINMVEEEGRRPGSRERVRQLLSMLHQVPARPPRRVLICTHCRDDRHITHELFNIKVIHNCQAWMDTHHKVASEIYIATGKHCVQLHSLVCQAIKNNRGEQMSVFALETARDDGTVYDCKYELRVFLEQEHGDKRIREADCCERVMFNVDFSMGFNKMLKLQPNSKYRVEIQFKTPHPVWYSNDIDDVVTEDNEKVDEEVEVACSLAPKKDQFEVYPGLIHSVRKYYGSHVKYVLYRTVQSRTDLDPRVQV